MKRIAVTGLVVALGLFLFTAPAAVGAETANREKEGQVDAPKSRAFRLDYGATLDGLPEGADVRVWLPVPQGNEHQEIQLLESALPADAATATDPTYGNKILYFETKGPSSGNLVFSTSYLVRRREVRGLLGEGGIIELTDEQRKVFLAANKKVPLRGKHLDLLNGIQFSSDPLAIARALYDRVDDHVRYDKSKPGYGNGDALWVCDSRFGNCTDFHSLFISLARVKGMPARFEIGFPLPPERGEGDIGGYHCWALFHADGKGWVPVDISEADKHPEMKEYYFGNLTENRVTFTTGRDINLVPRQECEPLNYFVYPHVEVDGKVWPKEKLQKRLKFADEP